MPELKKIDYRELGKETPQEEPPGQPPQEGGILEEGMAPQQVMPEEEKVSLSDSLRNRWALMDKKTKIEFSIFAVVVLLMISFFAYYIIAKVSVSRGKLPPEALELPEEQMPPDTAPETEFLIP